MKKYIILAIALVLSACATTAPKANSTCSDGSAPTKSISADGSYYVYACANSGNGSSKNGLGDAGAAHVAAALEVNSTLLSVDMAGNAIGAEPADALRAAWGKRDRSKLIIN